MIRLSPIAVLPLLVTSVAAFGCGDEAGGSHAAGLVSAPLVWEGAQCPVTVDDTVVVAGPEASLTIAAGCAVRFEPGAALVIGDDTQPGLLVVDGTADAPVRFTAAGDEAWQGIFLMATADAGSRLQHAIVDGAGASAAGGALIIDGQVADLRDVAVTGSAADGLVLVGGATFADGATVDSYDNAGQPLVVDAAAVPTVPDGRFDGNGYDVIGVRGGVLSESARWEDRGLPYAVHSDVVIAGDADPVLVIDAGVEVAFATTAHLLVGTKGYGGLRLEGHVAEPVILGALDANAGWGGLVIGDGAVDAETVLLHAVVRDVRSPFYQACVTVTHAIPTFSNVTIDNCEGEGLAMDAKSAFSLTSELVTVKNASRIGVLLYPEAVRTLPIAGSSYAHNDYRGILVASGALTMSATWHQADAPYVIEGDIVIGGHRDPVLTIDPGVQLRFGPDVGIYVGEEGAPGGLVANGTADAPVLFTSHEQAIKGEWSGICFGPETLSADALLDGVEVEYAGGAYLEGSVVADQTKPVIRNSSILRGMDCGVYARCSESGPPVLQGNDFGDGSDMNDGGALCLDGCAPF